MSTKTSPAPRWFLEPGDEIAARYGKTLEVASPPRYAGGAVGHWVWVLALDEFGFPENRLKVSLNDIDLDDDGDYRIDIALSQQEVD